MRIGKSPQWRPETKRTNGLRKASRLLEPLVAVDERDVGTDRSIFRDVAFEAIAHLDFEELAGNVIEELAGLRILTVNHRDHFEQLMERNRNRRRLDREFDHWSGPGRAEPRPNPDLQRLCNNPERTLKGCPSRPFPVGRRARWSTTCRGTSNIPS